MLILWHFKLFRLFWFQWRWKYFNLISNPQFKKKNHNINCQVYVILSFHGTFCSIVVNILKMWTKYQKQMSAKIISIIRNPLTLYEMNIIGLILSKTIITTLKRTIICVKLCCPSNVYYWRTDRSDDIFNMYHPFSV